MLLALAQPAAVLGLAGGFLVGLGLRAVAQRIGAYALGLERTRRPVLARPRTDVDPIGAVSAVLAGVGWGRGAWPTQSPARGRLAVAVLVGPVAVIAAGQLTLAAFTAAYPGERAMLLVNRPSDVLRGVVAPTFAGQLMLSVAVELICFGLVSLLPIPPLDGARLLRLLLSDVTAVPSGTTDLVGSVALLVLAVAPVPGALSPLLTVLDMVGTPLLRAWT